MKIPANNQWTQTNDGDIFGTLHDTRNVTFDKFGELKLSKKAVTLVDSDSDADFGEVMAIVYFDGLYHVVTDDKVFSGDLTSPNFTAVGSSPVLGVESDGIVCYDRLYVSDQTALAYVNTSGSWTTGIGSLTTGFPHPLCVFDSLPTYKLAVGDTYQVKTYDSSGNANATVLSLPQNYTVTSMVYRNGYLFVGTKEINGGEAAVFLWNGDGTSAQYKVDVGASWIYAMVPYRGAIALVTNEGELLALSGTTVSQLAAFPVFHVSGARWETGNALRGKVYSRGMVVIGDNIYINASGDVELGEVPEMKSGVWCYSPRVGLYHYASPSTDKVRRDADITVSSSVITTAATHSLILGDAVQFTTVAGLSGVTTGRLYYAIPVAATTLKLAGSRKDAYAGNYINITGTATSDTLQYTPNTDHGHVHNADSGAIALTTYLETYDPLFESDIIFGSELSNPSGAEKDVLCALSPQFNHGSFTTQKIFSDNVTSVWKSLYTFLSGVFSTGEKIIVKSRSTERNSYPTPSVAIVWASTTQFATTDPSVHRIIEVGDEVLIVEGKGQGTCAKVTAVESSTNTTTVTISESVGTAAASGKVRFTNFKVVEEITSTRENSGWHKSTIDEKSNWMQARGELRGFESTVSMLELTSSVDKSAL